MEGGNIVNSLNPLFHEATSIIHRGISEEDAKHDVEKEIRRITSAPVNARTFGNNVRFLMKSLKDENVSNVVKLLSGSYLFVKVYNYYNFPQKKKTRCIDILNPIVLNDTSIIFVMRVLFLKFTDDRIVFDMCMYQHDNSIKDSLEFTAYIQILLYLLRYHRTSIQKKSDIRDELRMLYNHPTTSYEMKCNIVDILMMCPYTQALGNELLENLREVQVDAAPAPTPFKSKKAVYDDTQNTHDTDINESVKRAVVKLVSLTGHIDNYEKMEYFNRYKKFLMQRYSHHRDTIANVCNRVEIDVATFNCGVNLLTLFVSLCRFIEGYEPKESREELWNRLREEMCEAENFCATGHLGRLVNVLQGFTTDEDLCITISDHKRLHGILVYKLNKLLRKNAKAMDALAEGNSGPFYDIISRFVNKNLTEYRREFKDEDVLKAVKMYGTGAKWSIKDDRISWES